MPSIVENQVAFIRLMSSVKLYHSLIKHTIMTISLTVMSKEPRIQTELILAFSAELQ